MKMKYTRSHAVARTALGSLGTCSPGCVSVPAGIAATLLLGVASPTLALASDAPVNSPSAAPPAHSANAHPYGAHVAEASQRFGIPEAWIWSVMRVESAGNASARSHAGAMGLMQVMPGTYAELRSRYGLGPNPYDPRDSILAGAAYLREMHDRYGSAGFLAAYNAGPGRWEEYVDRGRPLPAETVAYMARLGRSIVASAEPAPTFPAQIDRFSWRRAALFVTLDQRASSANPAATSLQMERPSTITSDAAVATSSKHSVPSEPNPAHNLFAVRRPE